MDSAYGEILLPEDMAKDMYVEISERVRKFPRKILLAGVLASDDTGSSQYVEWTREICQLVGIEYCLIRVSPPSVATYIKALNTNPYVNGIIVYYPIFGDDRDVDLRGLVTHAKDVEGLNRPHKRRLSGHANGLRPGRFIPSPVPCTAMAVSLILQWIGIYDQAVPETSRLRNQTICIINRSDIVGLPLAELLASQGARVYSVDIEDVRIFQRAEYILKSEISHEIVPGWTLEDAVKKSGVIISAVPNALFKVDKRWVQHGAICINVSSHKNFDSDILEVASKYVPRLGSLTIAALLNNLLVASQQG
ncbi:Methylenetetrahydrofolate dehydrogenase [NAD] [Penicillium rolfsii]|nr:Methylenetetrahydrofolate dehydrogenase [NAD] [Penicillium rolfsii]